MARLVFSGGPGDGPVHETEAMRAMALRLGVPPTAIALDRAGLNTEATVRNTTALATHGRVLAVSEFYHLPRIKLAYQRAGCEVFTVPARPTHWLQAWPLRSVLREIPAFWAYYGRGFTDRQALAPTPLAGLCVCQGCLQYLGLHESVIRR